MTDAQDHLDLLARDVASALPVGLLDTARGVRRRRTRGRLVVGGAVVAAVAVAVALPVGGTTPSRSEPPAAAPTVTDPGATDGTRWIAQDGYMVAVPLEWELTEIRCSNGAVVEQGVGFYYLRLSPKDCGFGIEDPPPSVGLVSSTGKPADLACDPTCSQTVVSGHVELRVRDLGSAEEVTAIVDTLQQLPAGWDVDPVTGQATPGGPVVAAPEGEVVTDLDDVVGQWVVVEVDNGSVPPDAVRGLTIGRNQRGRFFLSYSDGTNSASAAASLSSAGELTKGEFLHSLVGCVGSGCDRPSGFGVHEAVRLLLTDGGDLVLVGAGGTALAVYERA